MLKQYSKSEQLDPVSKRWLVAALDPYHDDQLVLEGLPDSRSAPSVVQMHNQSYTIAAPTSAAGGNWDACILYTGFDTVVGHIPGLVQDGVDCNTHHNYNHAAISVGVPFGSLTIKAVAAGAPFTFAAPITVGETHVALASNMVHERGRLIGVGFEVHNTTAEVYKQGSCVVAQLPDAITDYGSVEMLDVNVAPQAPLSCQTDLAPRYATTPSELMTVPTSCSWPAAKGVYGVPRMIQRPEWAREPSAARLPCVYENRAPPNGGYAWPDPSALGPIDGLPFFDVGASISGFSPVQTIFSGLSPQSTLVVTFRTIVEYFPALGSSLLPLATPSPPYDAKVFRLYSQVARNAPYAVPVGMNSAGDYFRSILRTIGTVLDVGAAAAGPYAPLVTLAGKGAQALSKIGAKSKSDKVDRAGAGAKAMPAKR